MTCEVCGAPAEVESEGSATGVDFDDNDVLFVIQKVRCAAGCFYHHVAEDRTTLIIPAGKG